MKPIVEVNRKPIQNPVESVTLTLSPEQCIILAYITGRIAGDRQESARKYADEIYDALSKIVPKMVLPDPEPTMYLNKFSLYKIQEIIKQW